MSSIVNHRHHISLNYSDATRINPLKKEGIPSIRNNFSSFPSIHASLTTTPTTSPITNPLSTKPSNDEGGDQLYKLPTVDTPEALPGDCDVNTYILERVTPYNGDESFLEGATTRTRKIWNECEQLMELERTKGGVLDVDTHTASTITSHQPGYILSKDDDLIYGLQTDAPLKRACKPRGGYKVVKSALQSYGYTPDEDMARTYTQDVQTHNDMVFSMYTKEMRKARHAHLLTGLPDAYGRGRIIGDYRRIALYGIDELIKRKKLDYDSIKGASNDVMQLRNEITKQVKALKELIELGDMYGVDMRLPAVTFQDATQYMWLGHIAALKEQDGAAMSVGRWDTFLDIYAERDLKEGRVTESQLQEIIDNVVIKMRCVRHLRPPAYNELFSGDPTWLTVAIGGCDESGRSLVTKTSYRFLHTLSNLGPAPEPNLTVLWSQNLPEAFKQYCAKQSILSSSIQYENDDMMRQVYGCDYAIACCVSGMRCGVDMQFFGARTNMVKLLLMCLNGGKDEIHGDVLCPQLAEECTRLGIGEGDNNRPINYDDVSHLYFDIAMPWMAKLYAETMNVIHYAHDHANYENVQMALHNSNVNRLMAFGAAGLSVVADSLSALKHDKVYPIRDESTGLTIGFRREHPDKEIPKFGNDDDRVDSIAVKVCSKFHEELDKQPLYRNAKATLSILTITSNLVYGKATGPSPDGRQAGDPFAPGCNPMHGCDKNGALASLSSVAKIPYSKCMDGISNTFCLLPNALGQKSVTRKVNLATILDGYFAKNGHHININVLSPEVLQDAHLHPEKYPNLTIRVSGYAVRFNRLTAEQREEVMKRTMHTSTGVTTMKTKTMTNKSSFVDLWCDDEEKKAEELEEEEELADIKSIEGVNDHTAVLGSVYSLETFTTTDGPGVRCSVYLQGCPKKCLFCCNPETQEMADPYKHPEYAMSSAEVVSLVGKYQPWLKPNDGGITVSGGEAMIQPEFVADIFKRVKALGLTTCLDTACYGNSRRWDKILPYTDTVLLCMKGMDNNTAAKVGQVSPAEMAKSKAFVRYIKDKYPHIKLNLRWVILKDITDTEDELNALIKFTTDVGKTLNVTVELIPYHNLGLEKYEALNIEYLLEDMPPYKKQDALKIQERLETAGITTILSSTI